VSIRRSAYFAGVGRLKDRDLGALLDFFAEAESAALSDIDELTVFLFERLRTLIEADAVMCARFDNEQSRTHTKATDGRIVALREADPSGWWESLDEHPIVPYRRRTHDGRAVTFSDFVSRRELRRREIYQRFFAPCEAEFVIGIEVLRTPRQFVHLACSRKRADFDDRDRLLLDLLRPYLAELFRRFEARDLIELCRSTLGLSRREAEVLAWVARGRSNRQIGSILVLSPGTIKKHLDNIYAKLGVSGRTGATALLLGIEQLALEPASGDVLRDVRSDPDRTQRQPRSLRAVCEVRTSIP